MRPNPNSDPYCGQSRHTREDPMARLRTTLTRIEDRNSDLNLLRNSYSSTSIRMLPPENHDYRMSNLHSQKKKSMQCLKTTLDLLEDKINHAKEELTNGTSSMKKKNQHLSYNGQQYQSEHEQSKPKPTDSSITIKQNLRKINSLSSLSLKQSIPNNFKPNYRAPYSPRRHSTYYVSEAIRAINEKNSSAVEHIGASIRILKQLQNLQMPDSSDIQERKVHLKRSQFYMNKKTLVLDLDQTLIHCVQNPTAETDIKMNFRSDDGYVTLGLNIRPYALTFLKKMAKKFQIILFTAGLQEYADSVIDELDPDGQIFQHRLYRHHCLDLQNQFYIKDLRIINRNLSELVLVDNAAYSYAFQLQNGIPILPFYDGADQELSLLESYLEEIEKAEDTRQLNKKTFKLHHYSKFSSPEELIEQLYMNNFY